MKDQANLPNQKEAVDYYYNHEATRQLMREAHEAQAAYTADLAGRAAAALAGFARRIGSVFEAVTESASRAAYYRDLSALSDWELVDRGIGRGEIHYFVDRCFDKPALAANNGHDRNKLAA